MAKMTQALVLSASAMTGDEVRNLDDRVLGKIEDLMLDVERGCVAYVVLSFVAEDANSDKLFAVPWKALRVDSGEHCYRLDMPTERLESAPGFDKHDWPDTADASWLGMVYDFYGTERYW